ncbi:WG repeat-containing protein [Pedobacter sp. Hv1]|uniref:WG repeat-containing protein n=1 Tax=Pedobacter sp. Hv1 TaxID=1740090 RepID=UPI0006D8A79C|nr:WG repeat-containing protein [Pedobacter sp. Hv1]KQC02624.1 hypothetical protein AQF98_03345 [Pedobacter sp. Hv1]
MIKTRKNIRYFNFSQMYFFISGLFLFFTQQLNAQEPGTIQHDAKRLAIDKFDDFSEGFAIITNNNETALINSKGEIVVPFNKYYFTKPFANNFILVKERGGSNYAYMNSKMEVITPFMFIWDADFDTDGYAFNRKINSKNEDFDNNISSLGKIIPLYKHINGTPVRFYYRFMNAEIDFNEGLVGYEVKYTNGKSMYGFANRLGKPVILAKYVDAGAFSEGLAPVAQRSATGEILWGFIDKTGKVVIPFQYRNKPGGFHSGLCYIKAVDKSDFTYAYIDKTGAVQFKISDENTGKINSDFNFLSAVNPASKGHENYRKQYREINNPFQGNFMLWVSSSLKVSMVSRNGQVTDFRSFLESKGFVSKNKYKPSLSSPYIKDEHIIFNQNEKLGMINTDGTVILPPIYSYLGHFDKKSGLAYAAIYNGSESKEGYINLTGAFVIIKTNKTGM